MATNNIVNLQTKSSWTSFTTTITATTTNPTPGTGVTKSSYYLQMGKILFVKFFFNENAGGADGSGVYLFNIPTGFTINTTVAPISNNQSTFGNCTCLNNLASGFGAVVIGDSTHYMLIAYASTTTQANYVSNTWYGMSFSPSMYCVSAQLPIL